MNVPRLIASGLGCGFVPTAPGTVASALTQKWFDQNHTSRSAKPISALTAASIRALASANRVTLSWLSSWSGSWR